MTTKTSEHDIQVLKVGTCPSLSGKSKLTYEIGCGSPTDLQVRISKNSGTGYFSNGWVQWVRLQHLLNKNASKPITCHTLGPLFKGQSVNTAGFLLAVLKHEGLVQLMEDAPRCYELCDATAFFNQIQSLMEAPAAATKKTRPKASAKQ